MKCAVCLPTEALANDEILLVSVAVVLHTWKGLTSFVRGNRTGAEQSFCCFFAGYINYILY